MTKIIEKPWGHEEIWAHAERYVGKILHIKSGRRLSLQFHEKKEETIRVLSGNLTLVYGESVDELKTLLLSPGEVFHVRPGLIHRFCAEKSDVTLIEVSTTEINDVIRIEDDFKRI
jgi:mannose-6-phosphate isomerase-like protein (cupin superfamily)